MTSSMRIRILWAFLAIVAILGGLAAASPYLINSRVVKKQISRQISDWMGLPVKVQGEPVVTVFPYLSVKLKDLEVASNLGSDEPPLVSMQVLKADMYWLPLLFGKFEVRRFYLENPVFELVRDEYGNMSWDMTRSSLIERDGNDDGLKLSDISLGNFSISEGRAHYVDRTRGQEENFSGIKLSFDWPKTAKGAEVDGQFLWRDELINVDARSDKPMELFNGGLSPLSMKISAPLFSIQMDGTAATMSNLQVEGDFSFKTGALRSLMAWLDIPAKSARGLGKASLEGRANLIGPSIAFSDMTMHIDDNKADGVLLLDFRRDRPLIQGTLASDDLDLGLYMVPEKEKGALLDQNLSDLGLEQVDLDIRLSANKLSLGLLKLGRTAATLFTRNNQLSFSISEAYAYGGRLEAGLELRPDKTSNKKLVGRLRSKANGILAGTLMRELTGTDYVTGTALSELDLQGSGTSLRQIFADAHGDVSLVLTNGGLSHLDLDNLQQALESDDISQAVAVSDGEAGFDVLSIRARMADGKLDIDGLRMTSGARALVGTATLDLPELDIDFPGTLALYRSADPATHSVEAPIKELPFLLQGSITKPVLSSRVPNEVKEPQGNDILAPGVPETMTIKDGKEPLVPSSPSSLKKGNVAQEDTSVLGKVEEAVKSLGEAASEILLQEEKPEDGLVNPMPPTGGTVFSGTGTQ